MCKILLCFNCLKLALDKPPSYSLRDWGSFPVPRRETDHSCSSTAEVQNEWGYASTPHMGNHGMHKDNLIISNDAMFSRDYIYAYLRI
jgi:hypothetical protein